MSQIQVKDATGATQLVAKVVNTGQAASAESMPVALSTEHLNALAPGLAGTVVTTTNTTAVTGNFSAIQVIEDATFSLFTETGASGQSMTGFAIPAGMVITGRITAYTLSAGKVRAYA